jgi:hypothetical protein
VRQGMAIRFVCTVAADRFRAYIGRVNPAVMPIPIPFSVQANPPTVVHVQAADGRRYELTMRIAVHALFDLLQPNPTVPGAPLLNFQASIVTSTRQL